MEGTRLKEFADKYRTSESSNLKEEDCEYKICYSYRSRKDEYNVYGDSELVKEKKSRS